MASRVNREAMEEALAGLVNRFDRQVQADCSRAINRMLQLIYNGTEANKAIATVYKEYPRLFNLTGLRGALVEAACYGYGIMPMVVAKVDRQGIAEAIEKPWTADGMRLSERLHGTSVALHKSITDIVTRQIRENKTALETARALYDGYNTTGNTVLRQELPRYIRDMVTDPDNRSAISKAVRNIDRLAQHGAPNRSLKAAYNELRQAVEAGNERAIARAVNTAINEKTRYVAERIARTEMARAYADGFFNRCAEDEDVVAYKFRLSTRHPVYDACDLYATANMYNLGKGIYPKDKYPPVPLHPHCLCKLSEVYDGEIDLSKKKNQQNQEIAKWAKKLPKSQLELALGKSGAEEFAEKTKDLDKLQGAKKEAALVSAGKEVRALLPGFKGVGEIEPRPLPIGENTAPLNVQERLQAVEYAAITSVAEAEAQLSKFVDAKRFGAVGVSLKGVHVKVADIIAKTYTQLFSVFDVEKCGGFVAPAGNTKLGKLISGAFAGYSPIRNSFILNRVNLKSVKAATEAFEAEKGALSKVLLHPEKYDFSKFNKQILAIIENSKISGRATVPESVEQAIWHEFGHMLEKKVYKHELWPKVLENMGKYSVKVSGYSTVNKGEYVAESFASWLKGENVIDPNLRVIFESFVRK